MPIYEYQCQECDETFEEIRSHSEATPVICPECGGGAEKRVSLCAAAGIAARTCSPGSGGSFGGG